jgi:DNA repair exonuclease SbcCD nuclease subunit
LFKKAAIFTDIHLGLKSNSKIHNTDCEEFVDWFIEQAKENNCETAIFCGDWHHNRSSVNIGTLDYTVRCLEKLGKSFENFYMFVGNHDLYYKDRRDVSSTNFARHIPGVTVIDEFTEIEDVAFVPWLVDNEWKKIEQSKSKYMFGHFELPTFLMNAHVQMPEHGDLRASHFVNQKYVFSGHFHKRQIKGNIHYIGNAFPHNYSDAWDDERGMVILDRENDKEPEYINWSNCPKYRTVKLSELLDPESNIIKDKMYLRVSIDIDISYEEASFIKETYVKQHNCREITLIPQKQIDEITTNLDISKFESVDEIVSKEIVAIDSESFDQKLLLDIYRNL